MGRRLGRRMFLCGTGGMLVGIPTLASILPRTLAAQPALAPKRFFAMWSRNGQINKEWYPTTTPAGYRLRDAVYPGTAKADGTTHLHMALPEDGRYAYAPLADFTASGISNVLGASLTPYLDKLTLLRGIDFLNYCGHNDGAYYGNYSACTNATTHTLPDVPTIDQVVAYSDRFYPTRPMRRSVHVGTGTPNTFSYSDYGDPSGVVEQQNCWLDPRRVWDEMFAGFTVAPTDPGEPAEDPNRSLVNGIYEDYSRVSGNRRLSATDRQTLERHMSFLADIESDLGAFSSAMCVPPDAPPSFDHGPPWSETHGVESFRQSCDLLLDMCVAAIRCDLTRVVTFSIGEALHDAFGAWEGAYHSSATDPSDWHHYAHDAFSAAGSMRALIAINHWIAEELFAALLGKLDVEEADGRTYLDNTLVCWGSELGPSHWNISVPTILAGSAGGAIQTGRYIDYTQWDHSYANPTDFGVLVPGIAHNRLLVTILQAMGLEPADYERGSLAGYGHREMTMGLRSWPTAAWDTSRIGEPLPGLMF